MCVVCVVLRVVVDTMLSFREALVVVRGFRWRHREVAGDFSSLAQSRLQHAELTSSKERSGNDTGGVPPCAAPPEIQAEVVGVVASFGRTGNVPRAVTEARMFRAKVWKEHITAVRPWRLPCFPEWVAWCVTIAVLLQALLHPGPLLRGTGPGIAAGGSSTTETSAEFQCRQNFVVTLGTKGILSADQCQRYLRQCEVAAEAKGVWLCVRGCGSTAHAPAGVAERISA